MNVLRELSLKVFYFSSFFPSPPSLTFVLCYLCSSTLFSSSSSFCHPLSCPVSSLLCLSVFSSYLRPWTIRIPAVSVFRPSLYATSLSPFPSLPSYPFGSLLFPSPLLRPPFLSPPLAPCPFPILTSLPLLFSFT